MSAIFCLQETHGGAVEPVAWIDWMGFGSVQNDLQGEDSEAHGHAHAALEHEL